MCSQANSQCSPSYTTWVSVHTCQVQAILTTGLSDEVADSLRRAHHFIDRTQVLCLPPFPPMSWLIRSASKARTYFCCL